MRSNAGAYFINPFPGSARAWRAPFGALAKRLEKAPISPGGTSENSPAFQRREAGPEVSSPEGTVEPGPLASLFQPSLRDFRQHRIVPGVETPGYSHPVPFGTKFHEFPYVIRLNAV